MLEVRCSRCFSRSAAEGEVEAAVRCWVKGWRELLPRPVQILGARPSAERRQWRASMWPRLAPTHLRWRCTARVRFLLFMCFGCGA